MDIHLTKRALDDEEIITQVEGFRKTSIKSLPKEIVALLNIAVNEADEDCTEHTTAQDTLNRGE